MAKSGSIYKQNGSRFWWIQYYIPGVSKPFRESTKTEDYAEAQKALWGRLGQVSTGQFAGLEPEKIKVDELFDMLTEDYQNNDRASLKQLLLRLKAHLRPFFGNLKAAQVGTRQITAYIAFRKKAGAKNATINRELEHLRRAFNIGFSSQPQLVLRKMVYTKLVEDNVREGILEHDQYLILRGIPEPYRTLLVCGYHLGTREGELLKVQWKEVDFSRGDITIRRYNTKTKKPRVLPIYGDMKEYLGMLKSMRDVLYPDCPWVFHHKGKRLRFDNRVWNRLVTSLGSPGLLFHDLRRTAVTNMLAAGFTEKEAMEISGHRTMKTFQRYHIIRRDRVQKVGEGMEKYYRALEGKSDIVSSIAAKVN